MPLTTPRILTAWDTDDDEDDEGMGLWAMANDFTGRWGGGSAIRAICHVCDGKLASHSDVAAVLIKPHDDPELMIVRRICRRCAPGEARARSLAGALLPDMMGGAA